MPLSIADAEKELLKHTKIVFRNKGNLKSTDMIPSDSELFHEVWLTYDGKALHVDRVILRRLSDAMKLVDATPNWRQIAQVSKEVSSLKQELDCS